VHGNDVTTEILKECSSKDELRQFGMYYSLLWNIIEDCDDSGNKTWANLVPENGDGGGGKVGIPRTEETKNKIRMNKPDQSGEKNGFYNKTHTVESRKKIGDVNRGKDLKTLEGKESIRNSMIDRWNNPKLRENQITALKNRKGEKRSEKAKESYRNSAKKREEKMTPEQKSARTLAGVATKKIKYAGMKRQRFIDQDGNTKYRWIPSIPHKD
jgi:hypothetical protein